MGYLRVCGPLPYRNQKEARCLPVCVVKRLEQLQHRVFVRVPRLLGSALAARHSQVSLAWYGLCGIAASHKKGRRTKKKQEKMIQVNTLSNHRNPH
jgi:hypothetical protein